MSFLLFLLFVLLLGPCVAIHDGPMQFLVGLCPLLNETKTPSGRVRAHCFIDRFETPKALAAALAFFEERHPGVRLAVEEYESVEEHAVVDKTYRLVRPVTVGVRRYAFRVLELPAVSIPDAQCVDAPLMTGGLDPWGFRGPEMWNPPTDDESYFDWDDYFGRRNKYENSAEGKARLVYMGFPDSNLWWDNSEYLAKYYC